jgi:ArsR family transcriptional regulator
VSAPLYQLKADFSRKLGHPARIPVLELLSGREHAVAELLPQAGIEAARLSQ